MPHTRTITDRMRVIAYETGLDEAAARDIYGRIITILKEYGIDPNMKPPEPASPDLGFYRVHWAEGGTSLAAIGMKEDGSRWIAPTNWISPGDYDKHKESIKKLEELGESRLAEQAETKEAEPIIFQDSMHARGGVDAEIDWTGLTEKKATPPDLLEIVERLRSITAIVDEEKDLGYELEIHSLWAKLKARIEELESGYSSGGGDCPTCGSKRTQFRSPLTDERCYICIVCTMVEGPRGFNKGDEHKVLGYGDDEERWEATPEIDINLYRAIAKLYEQLVDNVERRAYVFYDEAGSPISYFVTEVELGDYDLERLNDVARAANNAECTVKLEEVE